LAYRESGNGVEDGTVKDDKAESFAAAGRRNAPSVVGEFALFLKDNKKFWLIPLLGALLLLGLVVTLGGTAAAPFIYSLF
jgi:hypothetical protein